MPKKSRGCDKPRSSMEDSRKFQQKSLIPSGASPTKESARIERRWLEVWFPAIEIEIRKRTQWISHDILEMKQRHFFACLDLMWWKISWQRVVKNNLDDPRITKEEREELCRTNRR